MARSTPSRGGKQFSTFIGSQKLKDFILVEAVSRLQCYAHCPCFSIGCPACASNDKRQEEKERLLRRPRCGERKKENAGKEEAIGGGQRARRNREKAFGTKGKKEMRGHSVGEDG